MNRTMPLEKQRVLTTKFLDVIIVGGGLSGLFVADGIHLHNNRNHEVKWKLLEASDRLGGRLVNASPSAPIDMGGAWIWPTHQPHMRELTSRLSLPTFAQPDDDSATRIEGGAVQFIDKLAQNLLHDINGNNGSRIQLNAPVTSCKLLLKDYDDGTVNGGGHADSLVQVETADGTCYVARHVVFAVPPKVLSDHVAFDPPLSGAKRAAMEASRTWMVGVTKVALVYPQRFWDALSSNAGLPSVHNGPAFQVYDSGTNHHHQDRLAALTFFAFVPPDSPAQTDDALLAEQVAGQLATYWEYRNQRSCAALAPTYRSFHVYRWPANVYISGKDTKPIRIHEHPAPSRALGTTEWNGVLLFAGTETDQVSPGVMEGAIGSAKRVLQSLLAGKCNGPF